MSQQPLNRREFAKRTVLGTTVASVAGGTARADDQPGERSEDKTSERDDATGQGGGEEPRSEAELLVDVIQQIYPDERLTDDVLAEIRRDMERYLHRGRVLSGYPLKNSDQPAFVFRAWREEAE